MMPMLRRMVLRNSRTSLHDERRPPPRRRDRRALKNRLDVRLRLRHVAARSTMTRSAARRSFSSLNRSRARACRWKAPSRSSATHAGEAQQPQLVRHRALRLAQPLRRLLLRQAVDRDELCDGGSLPPCGAGPAAANFQSAEQRRLLLVRPHRKARHLPQTRELRRPQPPLSRDQLVAVLPAPHGQRLQMP